MHTMFTHTPRGDLRWALIACTLLPVPLTAIESGVEAAIRS